MDKYSLWESYMYHNYRYSSTVRQLITATANTVIILHAHVNKW